MKLYRNVFKTNNDKRTKIYTKIKKKILNTNKYYKSVYIYI